MSTYTDNERLGNRELAELQAMLEHGHFAYGAYEIGKIDDEYVLLEDMHCGDYREVTSSLFLSTLLKNITAPIADWRYKSGVWEQAA